MNALEDIGFPALGKRFASSWRPAAWTFLSVFAITAAIVFLLPNKYQTHLKILVKSPRPDPIVGADKQAQAAMPPVEVTEAQINTEIQLMTSADVLREVVLRCHLADPAGMRHQSQERREETALRQLEKNLTVSAVRGSNVIEASYESIDPRRATEVLRTLSDLYTASHRTLHGAPGSSTFLDQTSTAYAAQLASAESNLAHFSQTHHIVTLPEQKSLALAEVARLESGIQEGSADAHKSAETAGNLKQTIDNSPSSVERQRRSLPNQAAVEQLTATLLALENKRSAAVLRYQPEDRSVKELNAQIEHTRDALNRVQNAKVEEVSMGADPALDAARGEYIRISADEAGDQAQTRERSGQLAYARARLLALDAQTVAFHDLQRKVTYLEELDDSYRKAAESARMGDLLDQHGGSNLSIIEQPYQPSLPSSPRRGLLLALDLLWSLALAAAVAVIVDLLADRIRSPFELAQASGLPVLASLPANAEPLARDASFPALYLAMQRTPALSPGRTA